MADEKPDTESQLTALIDQLVQDRTFSVEGVEAIAALRERAADLESFNDGLERATTELRREKELAEGGASRLETELKLCRDREDAVAEREDKVTALELNAACAQARAETFKECFGIVFKNTEVRREMFGSVPVADPSGYSQSQPTSETVTRPRVSRSDVRRRLHTLLVSAQRGRAHVCARS